MDFFETLRNFNHYDIFAFSLLIFVLLALGIPKLLWKQQIKNIDTRKKYPELIKMYNEYFIVGPRGFNPESILFNLNENLFEYRYGSWFHWRYKISFPMGLNYALIVFFNGFLALGIISIFSHMTQYFIPIAAVLVILLVFETLIQRLITQRYLEFTNRLNDFLVANSLTREEVYLPPFDINQSTFRKHTILFHVFGAAVIIGMYLIFPYFS